MLNQSYIFLEENNIEIYKIQIINVSLYFTEFLKYIIIAFMELFELFRNGVALHGISLLPYRVVHIWKNELTGEAFAHWWK